MITDPTPPRATEFRDAIAYEVRDDLPHCFDYLEPGDYASCADAVLAMPELQAIRQALYNMALTIHGEYGGSYEPVAKFLDECLQPFPAVVAWVMEGNA